MNPLLCYVRARLQRRLFAWFGATILFTGITVAFVMGLSADGENGWRRETQRVQTFVGGRFARVWDSPEERAELARAMSHELDLAISLEGANGASLGTFGPCSGKPLRVPVVREGRVIGGVGVCVDRYHARPWRAALPLLVAGCLLWAASNKIAGRLSRPLGELARVAHELGSGNFGARVRLPDRHRFGETAALAITMNDMAARIERHLAEQRQVLAAVSHELRTPLARIRILTEMARDRGATPKTLDDLDREVMEMDALVGDLLASSRMDFAALSRRPLDAVEAASRALERAGADPTTLVVEREVGEAGPIRLQADATLLGRALANLLDNAKKHGGGVESLKVKRANGHVAFEVEDHGEGFCDGEEKRIFEPFYRRSEEGSLGLGLSLVKRIAEAHGGRAYAANRTTGGACVGVELPATS